MALPDSHALDTGPIPACLDAMFRANSLQQVTPTFLEVDPK